MNLKRITLTVCLLLMIWPSITIAKEKPIIYTVVQGDTLWDISPLHQGPLLLAQPLVKQPRYRQSTSDLSRPETAYL
jgi:hypothetical protein